MPSPFTFICPDHFDRHPDVIDHQSALLAACDALLKQPHPALDIVHSTDDLEPVQALAEALAAQCDTVLVLGTGGSSLGGQALQTLLARVAAPKPSRPAVVFVDNVDALTLQTQVANLTPERTGIVIISKSGQTLETIAQTLALFKLWDIPRRIESFRSRVCVITEDKPSVLRQLGLDFNLPHLPHATNIGGRFSVFSVVGALPALLMGLDMTRVRAGAAQLYASFAHPESSSQRRLSHPAVQGAAFWLHAHRQGCSQAVWWSYGDVLATTGAWWQQLFGESLGKRAHDRAWGMTPLCARGTVDQHSQLQLYIDGPADKAFSMILGPKADTPTVLHSSTQADLAYLEGKTLDDVMRAEYDATVASLTHHGRLVRQIVVASWTEETLGALMMQAMLETLVMAHVWGIDPYDQPAVEHGKVLARTILHAATKPIA